MTGTPKSKLAQVVRDKWEWRVFRGDTLTPDNWAETKWVEVRKGRADGVYKAILAAEDAQAGIASGKGAASNPRPKTHRLDSAFPKVGPGILVAEDYPQTHTRRTPTIYSL